MRTYGRTMFHLSRKPELARPDLSARKERLDTVEVFVVLARAERPISVPWIVGRLKERGIRRKPEQVEEALQILADKRLIDQGETKTMWRVRPEVAKKFAGKWPD